MKLEPLTKLIEAAGFAEFRELALRYLQLAGYRDVSLRDGWNDGGSDFVVGTQGGNPVPLAIQVSVLRADWQGKVKADFRRAKEKLGLDHGLYLTSRRIAPVDFTKVADELWMQDGLSVRVVDSQSLASAFFGEDEAGLVLETLGIQLDAPRPHAVPRPDLKEDAAYSFMLFGDASAKFRDSVIEQTVLSHLTRSSGTHTRESVATAAADALKLHQDQISLVSSAIDRMLQYKRLSLRDSGLVVDDNISDSFKVMRSLREEQWRQLGRKVDNYLAIDAKLAGNGLERASNVVLKAAGAIFLAAASSASLAVGTNRRGGPLGGQIGKRLKEVVSELVNSGVPEGEVYGRLNDLAHIISGSDIGRVLMAGELFVALASMETRNFERAFGADAGTEIYLDASVAIPMIAGRLYRPGRHRFSFASSRIYELAGRRDMPLFLPRVYLEEAATHLLQAVERYQLLLGTDDDLRFSTNSFVAHFTDLTLQKAIDMPFMKYVNGLGYEPRRGSFLQQRNNIMTNLTRLFKRYGIQIVDLPEPKNPDVSAYAQEAATFTATELHLVRTGVLLKHDASVIAFFMDPELDMGTARVLCSWDRLHLQLQSSGEPLAWVALDPPTLGDLLTLTRADADGDLMMTVSVAMELGEEDGQRGADVLDALVRIETEHLHDAELVGLMRQFKDAYMDALRKREKPDDLANAWAAWKGGSRELARH